jgi:hypothetical protein
VVQNYFGVDTFVCPRRGDGRRLAHLFRLRAERIVHQQDILTRTADAILSPANSFGFMDGGIDLLYSNFFGWELQDRWTVCESPSERSTPARYQSGAL